MSDDFVVRDQFGNPVLRSRVAASTGDTDSEPPRCAHCGKAPTKDCSATRLPCVTSLNPDALLTPVSSSSDLPNPIRVMCYHKPECDSIDEHMQRLRAPVSSSTPAVGQRSANDVATDVEITEDSLAASRSLDAPTAFDVREAREKLEKATRMSWGVYNAYKYLDLGLAACDRITELENQLREVTAERDAALDDAKVCDAQWSIAIQELLAAESSLSLAMTVVEAVRGVIPKGTFTGAGSNPLGKLLIALNEFDAASRISSTDNPREAEK